jgi:hypothetical protein
MNKKDILERAQNEKNDEREDQVKITSFRIGWFVVLAIMLLLIGLRVYYNESSIDLVLILMAQTGVTSFYQYRYSNHQKIYLFNGIVCTLIALLSLAALLSQYGIY